MSGPFKFGPKSLKCLKECHPDLQRIAAELIKEMDVSVICGHRNQTNQTKAYLAGNSQLRWPHSKHNSVPSRAMDITPSPLDWDDIDAFGQMCARVENIAKRLKINIRLGRDFHTRDFPHVELAGDK